MKRLLLLAASAAVLSACAPESTPSEPVDTLAPAETETAAVEPASPRFGTFGFDAAGMNRDVAPGDDFNRFANGAWLEATEIPSDRSRYGMFTLLAEEAEERVQAIQQSFPQLSFQSSTETWENFGSRISDLGIIVEAFIEGEQKRSPSVQGRITPIGQVEILSTHDQILGGPDNQTFLGCSFPADEAYRLTLQEMGTRIGRALANKGALGRYGVDFLAVPRSHHDGRVDWDLQAIEINLRMGGTTHPFMALKLLTNGRYEPSTGLFYNQQGHPKYYVASDNLQKERYRGLLPSDLMDIMVEHQLHFNTGTETGTVFHLIGCLSEFGKLGLTSIGNSPQQAEDSYNQIIQVLDDETRSRDRELRAASLHDCMSWDVCQYDYLRSKG